MDHTEFIVEIKNVIDPKLIKKLISLINKKATKNLTVGSNLVDKKVRNVKGYNLNPVNDKEHIKPIVKEIERLYVYYKAKFPKVICFNVNQIDLLKYSINGKYEVHIDSTKSKRNLSVIMNLNNEYKGGELIFTDQKDNEIKKLKLNKGSIVFFPSNFMYPHKIAPITEGTRYSIVAWLE